MQMRFHLPEDPVTYSEKVVAILLAAALPAIKERLRQLAEDVADASQAEENADVHE